MNDYQQTRDAAGNITTRYDKMLRDLRDDYEDELVVASLIKYYNLCSVLVKDEGGMDMGVDEDLLRAIERILQGYMSTFAEFNAWMSTRGKQDESQ